MSEKNTKTLAEAQQYVIEWRTQYPDQVKAFLIPNIDILELLGLEPGQGNGYDVRGYIGIELDDLDHSPKLLLVRVDADGKDIIDPEGANGNAIYDFTKPCPHYCDETSPLFNP